MRDDWLEIWDSYIKNTLPVNAKACLSLGNKNTKKNPARSTNLL